MDMKFGVISPQTWGLPVAGPLPETVTDGSACRGRNWNGARGRRRMNG